jgi:hypothetical protein
MQNPSFTFDRLTRHRLLQTFWVITSALLAYELFAPGTVSVLSNCSAMLVTAAALAPVYLWCSGRALGMPIFPLFSITFIWTYALPLISNTREINRYTPEQHLIAGLTIAGTIALSTFTWLQFVNRVPLSPKKYLSIEKGKGEKFFLLCLGLGVIFNIYLRAGLFFLDGGTFALIRTTILALNALGTFILAYRLGTKEITVAQSRWFLILFITYMISDSAGLLLVGTASTLLIAGVAFSIGRKKIPFKVIIFTMILLTFLHYGKAEMRAKYWGGAESGLIQPWQYPSWYVEWAGYSLDYFSRASNSNLPKSKEKQSFLERSSVIQLFLLAQNRTPKTVPYLNGATYAIIPELLIPRFLSSNKIASHEGTYLLNIHYGQQTRQDTKTTTIGWGLMAESYANFGELGCAGLGILLAILYGQTTKWTINAPLLSDRSLLGIIMISFAFQSEFSAGVFVAALFQSVVVIYIISLVLMKSSPVKEHKLINRD